MVQLDQYFGRERDILSLALQFQPFKQQVKQWLNRRCQAICLCHLRVFSHVQFAEVCNELLDPLLVEYRLQSHILLITQLNQARHDLRQPNGNAGGEGGWVSFRVDTRLDALVGNDNVLSEYGIGLHFSVTRHCPFRNRGPRAFTSLVTGTPLLHVEKTRPSC